MVGRPRARRSTDAAVDRAFAAGAILRTHVLRPTWHFVTPDDIRWMLQLTAPHVHALNAYQYRRLELDRALFRRVRTLFTRALLDGTQLTRAELAAILRRGGIVAGGHRLAYIVMHEELDGLICSGALRGKQHTYALLGERAPKARTLARDEALAELALRFFTSHGPATLRHFVWWSGLRVADAKAGLAMIRRNLTSTMTDGKTEWFGVPRRGANQAGAAAFLIPEYDEALVGSRDFGAIDLAPAAGRDRWKDTYYRPVIITGMRAGTWKRTIAKGRVLLETNLFAALTPAQSRALRVAAERYGTFLGLPVSVK